MRALAVLALGALARAGGVMPAERLPRGRLLVGYATSRSQREDKVLPAVRAGVNVVIWAFAHLDRGAADEPIVRPTFDVDVVRETRARIAAEGLEAAHLVAFGGWNGPHPDTRAGGAEWFACWRAWNAAHGDVFDGVDFDLEGHDDAGAATAALSPALVALVADFCRAARARAPRPPKSRRPRAPRTARRPQAAGFAVALAPAESYLDARAAAAPDLRLDHQPLAPWRAGEGGFPAAGFPYAGRNAYAAILAAAGPDAVDLVSVQLYEGYSRACHALTRRGEAAPAYVAAAAARLADGVDGPGGVRVAVPAAKLAVGFANGWADGEKFLRVAPEDAAAACVAAGLRGVMYWVIDEEDEPYHFARRYTAALRAAEAAGATAGGEL